jgi:HTH-type transcriptional regulator, glycine betaine synthesis regulator
MNNIRIGLTALQVEAVEAAGELAASISLARSVGQIFGLLYVSPEPLSLDDLCERLSISKGNASVNLRTLETWRAIERVWVQGSRRAHYRASRDLKGIALRRVEEGGRRRLGMVKDRLARIDERLVGSKDVRDRIAAERLKEFKGFVRSIEKGLALLPKLDGLLRIGL